MHDNCFSYRMLPFPAKFPLSAAEAPKQDETDEAA
jgi:hypothetical protein